MTQVLRAYVGQCCAGFFRLISQVGRASKDAQGGAAVHPTPWPALQRFAHSPAQTAAFLSRTTPLLRACTSLLDQGGQQKIVHCVKQIPPLLWSQHALDIELNSRSSFKLPAFT